MNISKLTLKLISVSYTRQMVDKRTINKWTKFLNWVRLRQVFRRLFSCRNAREPIDYFSYAIVGKDYILENPNCIRRETYDFRDEVVATGHTLTKTDRFVS